MMKSRIREMAAELIKTAAARQLREAPRFDISDSGYDEFAAGFPYQEKEDQQAAIDATLKRPRHRPADGPGRCCGDVGFGKNRGPRRARV